jgi:hypothetical protein
LCSIRDGGQGGERGEQFPEWNFRDMGVWERPGEIADFKPLGKKRWNKKRWVLCCLKGRFFLVLVAQ